MLEVQISEFGQIPKQLFDKPHVPKIKFFNSENLPSPSIILPTSQSTFSLQSSSNNDNEFQQKQNTKFNKDMSNDNLSTIATTTCDIINELIYYDDGPSHKDVINCMLYDGNGGIVSVGKDGLMKCYNVDERRQKRCVTIGQLPLSSCAKIENSNTIVLASWDNTM